LTLFEEISEDKVSKKKKKRQEAAEKAWQTIRKKKRKKMAESSRTLHEPGIVKISEPNLVSVRTKAGRQIIHKFDKTPPNIACGPFWELRWAFGCPLDCAYCYLRGTMRGRMQPRYVDVNYVLGALDYVFAQNQFNDGKSAVFNSGELADSWMNPVNMIKIVDKFEEQDKHKILTLTKFGINNPIVRMLTERLRKQTIVAFSINATKAARLYETRAPQPLSRIEAASQLSTYGYDVRVRIDPIFPIDGWREHYQDIVYSILSRFEPRRVILGTPRGLRKTIVFGKKAGVDLSWVEFLERKETGWGWKLPFETRLEIYRFLYDKLLALGFPKDRISICKETLEMWEELKLNYVPLTCNCYGRG
jgi:spore photoproduct lyase